ncbi:MAG: murein biosynthesis integral membrane protein MurJ [Anaerolineae bacterium]
MTFRRLSFYTAVIGGGFVLSKALGLVRDILIARAFGASAALDAYGAAFNFPDLLFALIPGGALASVFIPVLTNYLQDEAKRDEAWKFVSTIVNLVFVVVALLALIAAIGAPWLVSNVIAPKFEPARQALTADLMRWVLISTLIFSISGILTAILQAHNAFLLPALAPALYNLGIIAGALFLSPSLGVYGLAYGVVGGSVLHLLIQLPGLLRLRARYFLTLGLQTAGVGELVRLFIPRLVTLGVVRINSLLMTNLASGLAIGSIASLNYAYLIWQVPESLIGTAIALAVFPTLSSLAAQGAQARLRRMFNLSMSIILGFAIPSALVVILFARPIVGILLQRGAFQADATETVAGILQLYALAIIGESALELAARIFYAQHDSRTPMFVALAAMALRAALMFAWVDTLGARGLALAYAAGVAIEAGTLYVLARRKMHAPGPAAKGQETVL